MTITALRGEVFSRTTKTEFFVETCCVCGIAFAMPSDFKQVMKDSGQSFYCPKGHSQHYTGKTKEQRLQDELEAARQVTALLREDLAATRSAEKLAERRRAAAKGQLTKALNRIQRGVCPHCNQKFANVEEHMATEHPHEPEATLTESEVPV